MAAIYHFELWAPKGAAPICIYDDAEAAWRAHDERQHAGINVRLEIVTTITRRALAERPGKIRRVA